MPFRPKAWPQIVFFTQDNDFLFGEPVAAVVVRSRVRQARPLPERIVIWLEASRQLAATSGRVTLYELTDEGLLLPWLDSR